MGKEMEFEDSLARAVRLAKIPYFLQSHPKGLTTRELAELCGVCCRTMQRDLNALQIDLELPITQEKNRYILFGDYILPPVSFSLYESAALFLSTRLLLRQMDESNPHLEAALTKMAKTLPQSLAEKVMQGIASAKNKPKNPKFIHIFEQIALAWTTQRQVIIRYQSLQSLEVKEWLLEPYYMEMTGVGYSSYVIGRATREGKNGIFTFKLERIKKARLTGTNFEIPAEVDIGKLLSSSWGIIWGEDIEVVLKFSPQVTRRVNESHWHPSQIITKLPDGGCLLKLKIGSLMEITPWIKSWGPDVKVLEPAELREQFRKWAQELSIKYK